jgi:hypothetical protein
MAVAIATVVGVSLEVANTILGIVSNSSNSNESKEARATCVVACCKAISEV